VPNASTEKQLEIHMELIFLLVFPLDLKSCLVMDFPVSITADILLVTHQGSYQQ